MLVTLEAGKFKAEKPCIVGTDVDALLSPDMANSITWAVECIQVI